MKRGGPMHPKMLALANGLGIERCHAVGIIESIWHFAGQYARRGDIGRHDDAAIADAIGWTGDATKLIEVLVAKRWLDRCPCHRLRIHDWPDHADQAVRKTSEIVRQAFLECYRDGGPPEDLRRTDSGPPAEVYPPPTHDSRLTAQDSRLQTPGTGLPAQDAGAPAKEPVREVFEHWQAVMGKQGAKLTPRRRHLVKARLKDGYSAEQLKRAVDGCRGSAFHQGANKDGTRYDDLTLICRDGEHVEKFLEEELIRGITPVQSGPGPPTPREQRQKAAMVAMVRGGLKGDGTMPGGGGM